MDEQKDDFIKLTLGVYKVTDSFSEKEPLKFKIRSLANDILAGLVLLNGNPYKIEANKKKEVLKEVLGNVEILESFFKIAQNQDWIDSRNFLILEQEYDKIKGLADNDRDKEQKKEKISQNQPDKGFFLNSRQKKIVDIITNEGEVSVGELQKRFSGISKRTIRRDLEALLAQKAVERSGEWNKVFYRLS